MSGLYHGKRPRLQVAEEIARISPFQKDTATDPHVFHYHSEFIVPKCNTLSVLARRQAFGIVAPMTRGGLYLAIYDVTDDRERGRVADILEGFGVRVQKSAFEIRLTKTHRARLLREIEALALESGWLALHRLDEGARRHVVGRPPVTPLAEEHHAYVL